MLLRVGLRVLILLEALGKTRGFDWIFWDGKPQKDQLFLVNLTYKTPVKFALHAGVPFKIAQLI